MTLPKLPSDLGKAYLIFLHLAVVALGVEVILLASQNRDLKGGGQPAEHLRPGDSFSLADLSLVRGDSSGYSGSHSALLYVFSTKCPYCKRNLEPWNRIYKVAKGQKFLVFGICIDNADSTAAFILNNPLEYPVFAARDGKKFTQLNKVSGVPETVLLSSFGKVERIWPTVLSDSSSKEIITAISSARSGEVP